jgi:hypothetical protein
MNNGVFYIQDKRMRTFSQYCNLIVSIENKNFYEPIIDCDNENSHDALCLCVECSMGIDCSEKISGEALNIFNSRFDLFMMTDYVNKITWSDYRLAKLIYDTYYKMEQTEY